MKVQQVVQKRCSVVGGHGEAAFCPLTRLSGRNDEPPSTQHRHTWKLSNPWYTLLIYTGSTHACRLSQTTRVHSDPPRAQRLASHDAAARCHAETPNLPG